MKVPRAFHCLGGTLLNTAARDENHSSGQEMETSIAAPPECAWDTEHGLLVLFPHHQEDAAHGHALVVVPDNGTAPYYAGDLPAASRLWAIKAPRSGRFRLAFHPLETGGLNAPPTAEILFDDALAVDPLAQAGADHQVTGFHFRNRQPQAGLAGVLLEPIELPAGHPLGDVDPQPLDADAEPSAFTLIRRLDPGAASPRGPATAPRRRADQVLDVRFTVAAERGTLPADAVRLKDFDSFDVPTLIVDLTPLGDLAETAKTGIVFVHRPYGDADGFLRLHGAELPLAVDDDDRKLLVWHCEAATYLDQLGVYWSGKPSLRLQADQDTGIEVRGNAPDTAVECLVGLFHGDAYWLLPDQAAEVARTLRDHCPALDMAKLEADRRTAWLNGDPRLRNADWRGAETAGPFTVWLFADLLAHSRAQEGAASLVYQDLFHRFAAFARRPDLACVLLADRDLGALVDKDPRWDLEPWLDDRHGGPAAALAAALEPADTDLPTWVDDQSPAVQRLLWQFMLAGGRASQWRDLAIPPEAAAKGLPRLVDRLRLALVSPLPDWLIVTLRDLDMDPAGLVIEPRSLADAELRLSRLQQANSTLNRECQRVNRALSDTSWPGRLDPRALAPIFDERLRRGEVATAAELRRRLLTHCSGDDANAALAELITELKTRLALWGLGELVGANEELSNMSSVSRTTGTTDPEAPLPSGGRLTGLDPVELAMDSPSPQRGEGLGRGGSAPATD